MQGKLIREKKHRLSSAAYVGNKSIAFTGCLKGNREKSISKNIFDALERILLAELANQKCEVYVYLFMPDHFHFIFVGKDEKSNIKKCINSFKQKSGYWLSKNEPEIKWQKDYYDHIIRNDEDLKAQIKYVLNNPVRKDIVENWKIYPYKGSTVFDLDEWEIV